MNIIHLISNSTIITIKFGHLSFKLLICNFKLRHHLIFIIQFNLTNQIFIILKVKFYFITLKLVHYLMHIQINLFYHVKLLNLLVNH